MLLPTKILVLWNVVTQTSGLDDRHVLSCVLNIASHHFTLGETLVIISSNNITKSETGAQTLSNTQINVRNKLIQELHLMLKWPIQILTDPFSTYLPLTEQKVGSYIILHENEEQTLSNAVDWLKTAGKRNRGARILFIILYKSENIHNIKFILHELWKGYFINVSVLTAASKYNDSKMEDIFHIYTWFPYKPDNNCEETKRISLINRWMDEGHFLYRSSVFPEKLARDYQGYPIRISSFEYEPFIMFPEISSGYVTYKAGLEIQLINVILNSLNLTAKFLPPPTKEELWGTPLKNGSWTGMLGEIKLRKSDIVLAGCYYPCHMDIDFECSKIYKFDEERWYVPCAKPISSWTNIFRIFDLPLWIMFFLVYLLVTVLFWLLFKVRYAHNRYRTLNNCMLYLWAIILGFSPPQDIPDKIIIRFIFLLWTFYCMAINFVYQSFLITYLVDPGLSKQISTVDEILKSKLYYAISGTIEELLPELRTDKFSKREYCYDPEPCRDRLAHSSDYALLYSQISTDYAAAVKYVDSLGKPLFCKITENFVQQYITLVVLRGNPLLEQINHVILKVLESGLMEEWWKTLTYVATLSAAKDVGHIDNYYKLNFQHFQAVFYLLLSGYLISVIFFIKEFLNYFRFHRFKKHGNK